MSDLPLDLPSNLAHCPHCGRSPEVLIQDGPPAHLTAAVHCARCGWMAVREPAGKGRPPITATIGGPGEEPVPSPWIGIYRLAQRHHPEVTWTAAEEPCRTCERDAVMIGIHHSGPLRYERRLCLNCGLVLVLRSIATEPNAVHLDGGRVGERPESGGVRWLVRSLRLTPT